MGVFDDKKFESLDWISQATEPIDSKLNELLGKLPEEQVIDFELYRKSLAYTYNLDISIRTMVLTLLKEFEPSLSLHSNELNTIADNFELETDGDLFFDFENKKIDGQIKLIKVNSTLDEKVLENMLGRLGVEAVAYSYPPADSGTRWNEVIEVLGNCNEGLRTKSVRKKKDCVVKRLQTIFKDNEWKIKDTELANKVSTWILDYTINNDIAAFTNLCKIKVMTHKGLPIYSMEEVK